MCHKLRERAKEMFSFGERPKLKKSTLSTHTDVVAHVSAAYADRIALDMTLSQALLAFAKGFDTPPKCKNPACTCQTPWKQGTFQETCSRSCANKVVTSVGKCAVCGTEYPIVKAATHALTCSSECGAFHKHHKMSTEAIAKAKQDFKTLGLVNWSNRYLCRALDNGGYGYNEIRFGNVSWAKINDLVEEVVAVNIAIMEFNLFFPVVLSTKDKWKAWQLGSSYRTCAHCGGVGKFHETRGWQEFCSNDCQRAAVSSSNSDLKIRIRAAHSRVDKLKQRQKIELTSLNKYGFRCNRSHPDNIQKCMISRRLNSPTWGTSALEIKLRDALSTKGLKIEPNNTSLIGKELDIIIPEYKIAIEVNGVVWHSSKHSKNAEGRHLEKTLMCEKLGWRLLHVWSDELDNRRFDTVVEELYRTIVASAEPSTFCSARFSTVDEVLKNRVITSLGVEPDFDKCIGVKETGGHVLIKRREHFDEIVWDSTYSTSEVLAITDLLTDGTRVVVSRDRYPAHRNKYTEAGFVLVEELPPKESFTKGGGRLVTRPEDCEYYSVWDSGTLVYEYSK